MAGVFEKTRDKFDDEEKLQELPKTTFNYEAHEINDEKLKGSLIEKENIIQRQMNQIMRVTIELAKNLYEAREELATYKTGTFYDWFENLGLQKDFVYRAIHRYELFLETRNPKVMDLPKRAIEYIKKNKDVIEVEEIINAEKPTEKIKEIKERIEIKEEETIETLEKEEIKIQNKIEKVKALLNNLQRELEYIQLKKEKL